MFRFALVLAGTALAAGTANAATCEDSFRKTGNPIGGLRFIATVSVADMTPASALGQMRGIVAPKGYDILTDEPDSGSMLIEQPQTGKARSFPIEIIATEANGIGTVQMTAKLRPTMLVKDEMARAEMCGMLTQLKGGKAGLDLAAKGRTATTPTAAPIRMSVLRFSQQLSGEEQKSSASIPLRYQGKSFTLYGPVAFVGKHGDSYRIDFKLVSNVLTDIVPGQSAANLDVSCVLAKGLATYALQLKPGNHVELTGMFDEISRSTVWLKDCRPAKAQG